MLVHKNFIIFGRLFIRFLSNLNRNSFLDILLTYLHCVALVLEWFLVKDGNYTPTNSVFFLIVIPDLIFQSKRLGCS